MKKDDCWITMYFNMEKVGTFQSRFSPFGTQYYTQAPDIDQIRFTNRDLVNLGALAHGPFGVVRLFREVLYSEN